jgi:hypothetical protein
MIYINGIRASEKDLQRLNKDIKNGIAKITAIRKTQKGATALTVEG